MKLCCIFSCTRMCGILHGNPKNMMMESFFQHIAKSTQQSPNFALGSTTMEEDNAPHNPLDPWMKDVKNGSMSEPAHEPVWDINEPSNFHKAKCKTNFVGGRSILPVEPSPLFMVEMCFPDSMMDDVAAKTRSHAASSSCRECKWTFPWPTFCAFLSCVTAWVL